jgi:hypothetical protein
MEKNDQDSMDGAIIEPSGKNAGENHVKLG